MESLLTILFHEQLITTPSVITVGNLLVAFPIGLLFELARQHQVDQLEENNVVFSHVDH